MNAAALLQTRQLTVRIAGKTVCRALDLDIRRGERWAILGGNGVGKTTLLHTLAGLRLPAAGSITLDGASLSALHRRTVAQRIGMLFQDSGDAFPDSVLNTVLTGRHPWLKAWRWESDGDIEMARHALAAVGLESLTQRRTDTLSGGERRRVALATLLVQDPALALLDEPVNHLDLHQQIAALELLTQRARTDNKALVMTMHDVNLAVRYCDHVLLLFGDGEIARGSTASVLTGETLQRLYHHPVVAVPGPRGPVFLPG